MSSQKIAISAVWPTPDKARCKQVLDELGPILEAHWLEVRTDPSWKFDFNVEAFITAWQSRVLVPVVGRVDGAVAGVILLAIGPMLMSAHRKEGVALSVYLKPEHRGQHFERETMAYLREMSRTLGLARMVAVRQRAVTTLFKE